ncbi:MAG: CBS domain-containing protein [Nitrosopumilus sp.]|nr:CBS domain-containing protein [Nitrosopumilus sp.]MDH3489147.1 CBS domain-containing protein [Nitrosopumilus sp.]MDH3516146.1 CBS domain-containing protein [Nitrosopumilus sp.]MDH3565421.1 CBS domain-containing protein [Nitrosopumilus sp.]MDH5417053.1 CBS domain-containing protein [Nitrosopumilus sp.]
MKIAKDYLNTPRTIKSNSNLDEVLKKIIDEKKSRLLITDNGKITGIVTEKDLGLFLLSDNSERRLDEIPLSEIAIKIISVDEKTELDECASVMLKKGIGSLVITSNNNIVGILTKTDLVRYFTKTHSGKKIVGEYMSPYYAWQYSDTPLYKVVLKMINEKISRVIIRNHDEIPVGIVTFRDLFKLALRLGEQDDILDNTDPVISVIFPRKGFISNSGFGGATKIDEIMNTDIISVDYDDDLAKTGKLMLEKNINGVGVLSGHGNIIGIISKTDIMKALAFLK